MELESAIPRWMSVLLAEKFFQPCFRHEIARKNDKNVLCIDCSIAVCSHCLAPHRNHRLLQIRRYVYHDVIRVEDGEKLVDCASVQAYTNNGAKVIFINQRVKSRSLKASGSFCLTCDRCLQPQFQFCSLSCKVMYLVRTEGGIWNHLLECNFLPLSGSAEVEDGQMTPDSVLEPEPDCSSGSSCGGSRGLAVGGWFSSTAGSGEVVRKKRSNLISGRTGSDRVCSPVAVSDSPLPTPVNRRKRNGAPQRSPLY